MTPDVLDAIRKLLWMWDYRMIVAEGAFQEMAEEVIAELRKVSS